MSPIHFWASSYRFRDIKIVNLYVQKVDQCHAVQFYQLRLSVRRIEIYNRHFYDLICAKMRAVVTKVADTHTHRSGQVI